MNADTKICRMCNTPVSENEINHEASSETQYLCLNCAPSQESLDCLSCTYEREYHKSIGGHTCSKKKAMKHPIFSWVECWGCGSPTMKDGPFTVGCPGCDVTIPRCEKASDIDTQELLYPPLREYRSMDEAVFAEMEKKGRA